MCSSWHSGHAARATHRRPRRSRLMAFEPLASPKAPFRRSQEAAPGENAHRKPAGGDHELPEAQVPEHHLRKRPKWVESTETSWKSIRNSCGGGS